MGGIRTAQAQKVDSGPHEPSVPHRADGFMDESLPMFSVENQMNQDFRERLRHGSFALSGLMRGGGGTDPRALPWADELKPLWG